MLGLPRDYLNAQLGGWRTGQRRAQAPDCMGHIAKRLSNEDVTAVTHWLAAQPVPANYQALATLPPWPAGLQVMRCGSADIQAPTPDKPRPVPSAQVAQGEYLTRIGNCEHCHTAAGGIPFAGQRPVETPFGTVYSTNLTPDKVTGLGNWNSDDFWQAMHRGRSRDGRLLNPAFPYTSYTAVTRSDTDAIFSYLQTLAPTHQPNHDHQMRWPFGTQAALFTWRTLFFTPRDFQADTKQSADWNRGAYLVNAVGHCGECHTPRNRMGALQSTHALSGGLMPVQNWLAPSLLSSREAGVEPGYLADTLQLLKTGHSARATVSGPMALVVKSGTQYLNDADVKAMGVFLQSLTQNQNVTKADAAIGIAAPAVSKLPAAALSQAGSLYTKHCASCHGAQGEGVAGAYPALAHSRAVLGANSANLIQTVLHGGFAPVTQARPQPYGMPPFILTLTDADIALVLTYIRQSWGNRASAVSESDVSQLREGQASR
ncbi:MAG: hypothetical protein RLZZ371_1736 [Pseudomonadota bacterium]